MRPLYALPIILFFMLLVRGLVVARGFDLRWHWPETVLRRCRCAVHTTASRLKHADSFHTTCKHTFSHLFPPAPQPIGMFTGAFAQLNIALCGSPNDPGSRSDNWYCRQAAGWLAG